MKPLFIPLNTEHYNAFENGSKVWEFRLYGKRWNEKTCEIGRPVTLSKGYGKQNRIHGKIEFFLKDDVTKMCESTQKIIFSIYGDKAYQGIASIRISKQEK